MTNAHKLTCQLNCILMLDYKLKLPEYNINSIRFVELKICTVEIRLWILIGIPYFLYLI
jgi:hypothetical protein